MKKRMDNFVILILILIRILGRFRFARTQSTHVSSPNRPLVVIISCVCCLLQSSTAFIMLLPIWWHRQCAITFLKMQFCLSTSSIMIIFLLGFLRMLPMVSDCQPYQHTHTITQSTQNWNFYKIILFIFIINKIISFLYP